MHTHAPKPILTDAPRHCIAPVRLRILPDAVVPVDADPTCAAAWAGRILDPVLPSRGRPSCIAGGPS